MLEQETESKISVKNEEKAVKRTYIMIMSSSNIVKMLLENSLAAGSKSIKINIERGGYSLIEIEDDGYGFSKDDMNFICEREIIKTDTHFLNLDAMVTYGYRKESLYSISFHANLTILTKSKDSEAAVKAEFSYGKLLKKEEEPASKPEGTKIIIKRLYDRSGEVETTAEVVEAKKIINFVRQYAIINNNISISFKNEKTTLFQTQPCSTIVSNIELFYGSRIKSDLHYFSVEKLDCKLKMSGYISKGWHMTEKKSFLLYTNNIPVKCSIIKHGIQQEYSAYIQENLHPFIFINLELDPKTYHLTGHNSKYCLFFRDEEEEFFWDAIKSVIATELRSLTMSQSMLKHQNQSMRELSEKLVLNCSHDLLKLFQRHCFIGSVSRSTALIKHNTNLWAVSIPKLSTELFYQKLINLAGNITPLTLETPLDIKETIREILLGEGDENWEKNQKEICSLIQSKAQVFSDFFSLQIDYNGFLRSIPLLLENYVPLLSRLPLYIISLARRVNWGNEKEFFASFCHETAAFYSVPPGSYNQLNELASNGKKWGWIIEEILFPEMKTSLLPGKSFLESRAVNKVADLRNLHEFCEHCKLRAIK